MVQYDMGISYHAKLMETKENIDKLQSLSFDLTKIKETVEGIEQEINKKVEEDYQSFGTSSVKEFLYDSLSTTYKNAVEKLDKINNTLKQEYEVYYKINRAEQDLRNKIEHVDESNISRIIQDSKKLLKNLKTSTTIDFEVEKPLVLRIYELVYKALKLELIYTRESTLLENVKEDSIDVPYIAELIKKDILEVEDEKEELTELLLEIEKQGLDDSLLLDKNLIMLLALCNKNDLKMEKKDRFLKNVEAYEELMSSLENRKLEEEEIIESLKLLKQERKSNRQKGLGKRIAIFLNTLILTAGIMAGAYVSKELTKGKDYKTITTTYDSSTEEFETEEEYLPGKKESISLVEYSPWDSPGYFRDEYERKVYEYSLENLKVDYSDISKYLNEDIKDDISYTYKTEKEKTIPEDYGYPENKYIITEVKKDTEDYHISDRPIFWALADIALSCGLVGLDRFLFQKLSKDSLKVIKEKSRGTKEEIKRRERALKETQESKDKLELQYKVVSDELQEEYYSLPFALKTTKEVQAVKRKIKQ